MVLAIYYFTAGIIEESQSQRIPSSVDMQVAQSGRSTFVVNQTWLGRTSKMQKSSKPPPLPAKRYNIALYTLRTTERNDSRHTARDISRDISRDIQNCAMCWH
jgi:hypothetical protein